MKPSGFVIAFSGSIGSGKTAISSEVATQLSIPRTSFGSYIRHLTHLLGLEVEDRHVLQHVGELMSSYPELFVKGFLANAAYIPGNPLIIDGVRHVDVLQALSRSVGSARLILVYIACDSETRVRRLEKRDFFNFNFDITKHSTEADVPDCLRELADVTLFNGPSASISSLAAEVIQTIENLEH